MTAFVTHQVGQSIYDLCLQVYGTLDRLIKFCTDNNVTDLDNIPQQKPYQYDTTLVKYEGNKNVYSTAVPANNFYATEDGTGYYGTEDGTGDYEIE